MTDIIGSILKQHIRYDLQPINQVSATGCSTVAWEMLARLDISGITHGPMAITRAISARSLHAIDLHSFEHAAHLLADRKLAAINVNVSPESLHRLNAVELRALVEGNGGSPHQIIIELTEESMIALDDHVLTQLREAGFKISLDDFSSGFGSLGRMISHHFDQLKIDGELVKLIFAKQTPRAMTILDGLVDMCHKMGIALVAEHVESKPMEDFLFSKGVILMQGWLYKCLNQNSRTTANERHEAVSRRLLAD